jgi:ribosomal-protein-alanine N-acetyltransferase
MSTRSRRTSRGVPGLNRAVEVGERVFLRRLAPGDREEFLALRRGSRMFLKQWEPTPPKGVDTFGKSGFAVALQRGRSPLARRFVICRKDSGTIMGSVSFNMIVRGPFQSSALGYWIGKPFARNGYMTESVQLALQHAFVKLKLHRVQANIIPRNAPSIATVRRCGFRYEGTAVRYLQINGRWQDHEQWSMTIEDWRKLRRRVRSRTSKINTAARSRAST